ncbi:putative transcriptional regulator, CopG family [Sulfolobus islandicus Y.G.57.14]|uniref:Putative transcriptional regulator, CopG family n=1 Tax=Saccharolobus islandicus (strain Y.G.57.14 / Yellowstone \|nr:ribbon-helix-helix protein, CopG family [Sulfolobus islandicus]ACP46023.1 putative transcriptional regulator, CopG family [Sulfolobus islandicus Y.G.57.14]
MKARVEYIKLPKSYSPRKDWDMDTISFKLPPEMKAKLDIVAHKRKVSRSELIRIAITKYLEEVQ